MRDKYHEIVSDLSLFSQKPIKLNDRNQLVNKYFRYNPDQSTRKLSLIKVYHMWVSTRITITCEINHTPKLHQQYFNYFTGKEEEREYEMKF